MAKIAEYLRGEVKLLIKRIKLKNNRLFFTFLEIWLGKLKQLAIENLKSQTFALEMVNTLKRQKLTNEIENYQRQLIVQKKLV